MEKENFHQYINGRQRVILKFSDALSVDSPKFGERISADTLLGRSFVCAHLEERARVCVHACGGLLERDSAVTFVQTGRCRFACEAVRAHAHAYTRETGGVPIYNADIIADYLRFRVDNRKFSQQKGAGSDLRLR